jgi:hypothetical protein
MAESRKAKRQAADARIVPSDRASKAFVQGLVDRGEAAHVDADGRLPKGATHEIVGKTEEGLPIVARRRFSAV